MPRAARLLRLRERASVPPPAWSGTRGPPDRTACPIATCRAQGRAAAGVRRRDWRRDRQQADVAASIARELRYSPRPDYGLVVGGAPPADARPRIANWERTSCAAQHCSPLPSRRRHWRWPWSGIEPVALGRRPGQDRRRLFPLSGNAANAGRQFARRFKAAIQLAVDIINSPHPGLSALPSVGPGGLANLGGAKIVLVIGRPPGAIPPKARQPDAAPDHPGEGCGAMIGAYQSNVSFTATAGRPSATAIPFVRRRPGRRQHHRAAASSGSFRTTPDRVRLRGELHAVPRRHEEGRPQGRLDRGRQRDHRLRHLGRRHAARAGQAARGINVVAQIPYSANAMTDVTAQVLQLKEKNPDAVIFVSYTAGDAILYMKDVQEPRLHCPPMVIGDDPGFSPIRPSCRASATSRRA